VTRAWLLLTLPLLGTGVVAVVKLAFGLVRFTRDTIVASLAVIPEQSLLLPSDDRYAVFMQGKFGDRGFGDLRFVVTDDTGRELRLAPAYMRTTASSLDGTVRLELFSFSARAGRHVVRTVGIDPNRDYRNTRVVIGRARGGQLVARIIALVIAGALTVGSLVATGLLIASPR
jgi:hypothetical protein